mmetsp:Transcript_36395/g.90756  ORF Transcript_36395/g.90756 Transcript_36395/m.90756 type:complete len:228 (+) Transcript_36395:1469-2152(+)
MPAQNLTRGEKDPGLLIDAQGVSGEQLPEDLHQIRHECDADEVREPSQADQRGRHEGDSPGRHDTRRILQHPEVHFERRFQHSRLQLPFLAIVHSPGALVHVAVERVLQVVLVTVTVRVMSKALEPLLLRLFLGLLRAPLANQLALVCALFPRLFARQHLLLFGRLQRKDALVESDAQERREGRRVCGALVLLHELRHHVECLKGKVPLEVGLDSAPNCGRHRFRRR